MYFGRYSSILIYFKNYNIKNKWYNITKCDQRGLIKKEVSTWFLKFILFKLVKESCVPILNYPEAYDENKNLFNKKT